MMEFQRPWRFAIRLLFLLLPARLISASIQLAGGKYETFSSMEHQQDIQGLLNLGKDYASMKQASVADIEEIYKHGEHGVGYTTVNGERLKHTLSFADLSRALSADSLDGNNTNGGNNGILLTGRFENPLLYLSRHYFDTRKSETQRPGEFENEIVLSLLLEMQSDAALDAMLVLNTWMYISNILHQVTTSPCDSEINIDWNTNDRLKALDRAAALWFGLEADTGSTKEPTTGDDGSLLQWMGFDATEEESVIESSMLLSHLADESSERLGGNTSVNHEILYLFNFVQDHLVHHGAELDKCSKESSPSNHIIRAHVGRLMDLMTVPLIQNLWYFNILPMMGDSVVNRHRHFRPDYTVDLNSDFSFLMVYQAALMPRLYACDPNLAKELSIDSFEETLVAENDNFRIEWLETFQREGLGCFRLSCEDVGCDQIQPLLQTEDGNITGLDFNVDMDILPLEGYNVTSEGTVDFSRIDRDFRMLGILLESRAYDAAIEIFTYGYHSDYSLRQLAMEKDPNVDTQETMELPEDPSQASIFRNYMHRMNMTFAGDEIMSALNRRGVYETASLEEVRAIVIGNIQANVLYLSIATSFELSINQCERGDKELALKSWDQGAVIFFGSIEGRKTKYGGGTTSDEFTSLFGLAKRMSTSFEALNQSGHDDLENKIVKIVSKGAELVELQFCSTLNQLWEQDMLPMIQTTLIQAFMYYIAEWMYGDEGSRARNQKLAEAYSNGVLPLIDFVNSASAERMHSTLNAGIEIPPRIDPVEDLGSTISSVLPAMGIRCEDVGISTKFPTLQLCFGAGPEQLALDIFNFSSIETFHNFSAVSLDVQEILRSRTVKEARVIFLHGIHGPFSLASLSRFTLGVETRYDPTLNIFGFASKNNRVLGDGDRTSFDFTNGVVESLLLGNQDTSLIAEAAIVCNSWLMIVHKLHQSVNECKQSSSPLQLIDEAVALWIGRTDHAMKNGWMLHEVAEQASSYLGLEESKVNLRLLAEFNALQEDARQCVDGEEIFLGMRKRVNEIIRLSLIPLIQMLFVNLWQDDEPTVRVYSRAIFPLVVACNPKMHSNLSDVFYSNFVKSELNETTYDSLAMFLKCSRLSCSDLGFLDTSNLGFRYFAAEICERLEWKSRGTQLVGYIAENDVSEQARLDLDILEVNIMMKMGADEAAEDLYLYGKHSLCEDNLLCSGASEDLISLHSIAKSIETSNMYHTNMFVDFYGPSFASNVTLEAVRRSGTFSHASWAESSKVVVRNLQVMVALPAVVGLFQSAIGSCYIGEKEEAVHQWDSGVALYTGAIDAFSGKIESTNGFLLRSLSNSLCSQFHGCDNETGESRSNKYLIPLLKKARKNLADSDCQIAKNMLDSRIVPLTRVPLLQGVLGSIRSAVGQSAPTKESLVGFVYARSLLPIFNATNTTSSNTVEKAFGGAQDSTESVEETLSVYEAIGFALPALGIDCNLVNPTLCALQHNEYALPSYVKNFASIDLDLREIKSKLVDGNQTRAYDIYENGMHSFIGYGGGMNENSTSLKSLGSYTTADLFSDPLHVLFLHYETVVKQSDGEGIAFGHPFVQMMFDMNASSPMIAESILVCDVWMRVAHSLHMALETCKRDSTDSISIAYSLDVAAAYWIGEAGTRGRDDDQIGNLWYSLTDELARHYASIINPNDSILRLLDATKALVLTDGCETKSLMSASNKVIAQMKIPLVQGLIHGLKTNDRDRIRLYSAIVVPLISGCNPADVYFFEETLARDGDSDYDADEIIDRIYHMLPCIDLDCSKIGIHEDDESGSDSRCSDMVNPSDLGDDFLKHSRFDLDLREIDIMLQMGSKQAAEDIFFLGKHSNISLSSIAHNAELSAASSFLLYSDYFKSPTYAHDLVLDGFAFMGNGLSQTEARVSILRFIQTMLLGHAAVNTVFEAVHKCDGTDSEIVEEPWNSAAGLLLGSVDRSREVDSSKWYTLYDLAQNLCSEFDTCSDGGIAFVNTELMSALNAGRVAAQRNNCEGLKAAAEEIQVLILVPVVQGLLSAAMKLSMPGYTQENAAEAYVYSRLLLPLIQQIDGVAAQSMESTFALRKGNDYLSSTGASTFNTISEVLEELGLDCNLVGALEFCEHSATTANKPSAASHILPALGGVLIVLVITAAIYLIYRLSTKEESVGPTAVGNASEKKPTEEEEEPSCSGHTRSDESGNGSNSSNHFLARSSLSIAASDVLQEAEEVIVADHMASVPLGTDRSADDVPKNLEIKIIEFEDAV